MIKSNQDENKTGQTEHKAGKKHILKIIQLNTNKSMETISNLLQKTETESIEILNIQEPNIKGGKVRGITNNYTTQYQTTDTKVVTAAKNKRIKMLNMPTLSNKYIQTSEINIDKLKYYNINVYLPPERNKEVFEEHIEKIKEIIPITNRDKNNLIIWGDINSKSTLWESEKTDARGREWERIIENNQLVILNEGKEPSYESSKELESQQYRSNNIRPPLNRI